MSKISYINNYEIADRESRNKINNLEKLNKNIITRKISEFGAIGDGITDDTTALQEGINNSDVLIIDSDKTFLCGQVLIDKPLKICGKGTLKQKDVNLLVINSANVIIQELSIDGNDCDFSSIYIKNDNVVVEYCTFFNKCNHYILTENCKNAYINNNVFDGAGVTAVVFHNSKDSKCINNVFNNTIGFNVQTRLNSENIVIQNNTFKNEIVKYEQSSTSGQQEFIFETESKFYSRTGYKVNNSFNNNGTISKTENGYKINFSSGLNAGDKVSLYLCNSLEPININSQSYNIIVCNNFIDGSGDSGIVVGSDYHNGIIDPNNTSEDDYPKNIIINNNHIKNCFYTGIFAVRGKTTIKNNFISSCAFAVNHTRDCFNSCIYAHGKHTLIDGNTLSKNENDFQTYGLIFRPNYDLHLNEYMIITNNIYNGNFTKQKSSFSSSSATSFYKGVIDLETDKNNYPFLDNINDSWSNKPTDTDYVTINNVSSGVNRNVGNGINPSTACIETSTSKGYIDCKLSAKQMLYNSIITLSFDGKMSEENPGAYVQFYYKLISGGTYVSSTVNIDSTNWKHYEMQINVDDFSDLFIRIGQNNGSGNAYLQNFKITYQKHK